MTAYVDHLVEQAVHVLQTQHIAKLHTTPPLVEAMARDDDVVTLVNQKVGFMLLSGAHVDADTLDLLSGIFPRTTITMAFGGTMIPSEHRRAQQRPVRLRPAQPLRNVLGSGSRDRRRGAVLANAGRW